jgi:hypothetical protein
MSPVRAPVLGLAIMRADSFGRITSSRQIGMFVRN